MRAAIYARVSTTDQSCDVQLRELRQYATKLEMADEYVDGGWSGASARRPEFDRLLKDTRNHRLDVVVVWKLDGLGRSVVASVMSYPGTGLAGGSLHRITQNIDTDDSNARAQFLLHILATFADVERELTRERVRAGGRAVKARGKKARKRIFRCDEAMRLRPYGKSKLDLARS